MASVSPCLRGEVFCQGTTMAFDTIIKGGTRGRRLGAADARRPTSASRTASSPTSGISPARSATIDADGLIVMPGIVDAHTHYDPQLTFEPFATSSCYHGVTSVVAGNCGYSIAPVPPAGPRLPDGAVRQGRGHDAERARAGPAVGLGQLPVASSTRSTSASASTSPATSATRRCAASSWATPRRSAPRRPTSSRRMQQLVREAMHAGAAGFSSSLAPTHVDQFNKPVPSRHADVRGDRDADRDRRRGRRRAASRFLPETAVRGLDAARPRAPDRARARAPACRSSCRAWAPSASATPSSGTTRSRFLEDARQQGAAIFSILRTQPFMRPFNWQRGTQLFDGVFHWRDLSAMPPAERLATHARPAVPRAAALGPRPSRTPTAARARRCRRRRCTTRLRRPLAARSRRRVGKSLAQLAKERGVHAADVMCELAVADGLATQFLWNTESAGVDRGQRRGAAQPAHDHRHRRRRRARRPRRRRRVVDVLHPLLAARPPALLARGRHPPHHAPAGDDLRHQGPRPARARLPRRRHAVRSRRASGSARRSWSATCPAARRAGRCGPRASCACW